MATDPTLVEQVEQALAKAEWPKVIVTPNVARDDNGERWPCLRHEAETHIAFDYQTAELAERKDTPFPNGMLVEAKVECSTANLFCANCTVEQAEVIAHIRPWLSGLVAEVRRLEAQLEQTHCCDCGESTPGTDRYCSQCRNGAAEGRMEAAFHAGAEQMREAAARICNRRSCTWSEADDRDSDDFRRGIEHAAIQLRDRIRSLPLPVPPAPSPAHDGKEGA